MVASEIPDEQPPAPPVLRPAVKQQQRWPVARLGDMESHGPDVDESVGYPSKTRKLVEIDGLAHFVIVSCIDCASPTRP
jgi:hypothetical protein